MTKTNTSFSRRFITVLGSPAFFWAILAFLVLQAAWIALSGRYPMAFDEDFHLGIIRLYAHHLGPFWSGQPANADMFGAVARDPSYLYHFLMSFPYRLISVFTTDQTIQVLILRAINIGLFAGGLALYRRLMLKTGVSKALVHCCLLVFVLVPIVPFLAAQINYDNLFLPATALALLLAVRFDTVLAKQKRLDSKSILQLLIVCLLASLVKYAFLPVFAAIAVFVIVRAWQSRRVAPKKLWRSLATSWQALSGWLRLGLVVALILSAGLFVERYGVNLVRYHEPVPDCSKVLTVKQCSAFGAWVRDYDYEAANVHGPRSPVSFTREWLYGMWLRTFFAVGGSGTDFETRGPLLVPSLGVIILAGASVLAVPAAARRLLKRYNAPVLWLFFMAAASYIGILWLDEYKAFLHTGHPVAINGRYLLPVLLPVLLIAAAAVNELIKQKQALRLVIASAAILCFAWGGGTLTFILRSDDAWYWPSPAARTANHAVQRVLGPVTPGYIYKTQFLRTGV
jgi:hypothetical protein